MTEILKLGSKMITIPLNDEEDTCGECDWWNCQRLGCCMNPDRGEYSDLPDGLKPCKRFKKNTRLG